ncbi:hypothetical protein HOD38_00650 [archaeon]|jgi:hypothetical protein|nr:hypothetical protein [archaeon]MBT4396754.1 hypothetical protein [archaeon]MBT4441364.1 hypothetical protein [archaeon]
MKVLDLHEPGKDLMRRINIDTGLDSFVLYGTGALDLLLDPHHDVNDLDIATQSSDIGGYRGRVISSGFEITEPYREYVVCHDKKVGLVYAQREGLVLDVCFLDDFNIIGQFDLESIMWRYPELDVIDRYDALGALERRKLVAFRGLDGEHPLLLASRFVALCGKYNLSVVNEPSQRLLASAIAERLGVVGIDESDPRYASCLSSLFEAIVRSSDKNAFVNELVESRIVKLVVPELETAAENDKFDIGRLESKQELYIALEQYLHRGDVESLKSRVKLLKKRNWDEQDA